MGIWEILGISPVRDKRQIKRAYAARTKEIHPEDAPEEFRLLYAAYQAALQYAENPAYEEDGSSALMPDGEERARSGDAHALQEPESTEPEKGDESVPEREAAKAGQDEAPDEIIREEDELGAYFERQARERDKKIALFVEKWKNIRSEYWKQEVKDWWKNYLESEDFREIQWYPALVKLLGEDMERQLSNDDTIRLAFWDAYGFKDYGEEKNYTYQEDLQKLRKALYPVYERRKRRQERELQERINRQKEEKSNKVYAGVVCLALAIFILSVFGKHVGIATEGRMYVESYMEKKYPQDKFSRPKRVEKTDNRAVYEMSSLSHPDISVTVELSYDVDDEIYAESEDYGEQLLRYYGEQYGFTCGGMTGAFRTYPARERIAVLYYSDDDAIDEFCAAVIGMFQEQEELQQLDFVGICKKGVLYPDVFVRGGVRGCRPVKVQIYRPWEMDSSQMEDMVREADVGYMFHFEPWNITWEQYREWGPAYGEMCERLEEEYESGFWYTLCRNGEDICSIYIPIYTYDGYDSVIEGVYFETHTRMILVGDTYFYLMAEGAFPEAAEDGSGFFVEKGGESYFFGEDEEEELSDVEEFL